MIKERREKEERKKRKKTTRTKTAEGWVMKESKEKDRKKNRKTARWKPTGGWVRKDSKEKDRKIEIRQQDGNLQGLGDERKKGERQKKTQKDDSKKVYGRGLETGLTRQPRRSTWPAAG